MHLCESDAKDLRARLIAGDLELVIYALPGEEPDERTHVLPLFRERMVMAVGRSPEGLPFEGCIAPVRYIFCIGVPKALATDYLRIVGLLARILKHPATEAALRDVESPQKFIDELSVLEATL